MGEVYRAYDERLDRWVALKLIRSEHLGKPTTRERFRREARAAAGLSHPSIVQIHDVVESSESDAIVMELVEGEPLSSRIARGPLPVPEAVRLGKEIAEGLAAAHAKGLIHRDLKPENVMITAEGRAKILDFGLAKRLEGEAALTADQRVLGTFRSMSPEQARGLPLDPRSDLFSLGLLVYEMLSGRSPFEAGSTLETLTRICSHRQAPLREVDPEIPKRLAELVSHLLEKDPARRPQSALQVAESLQGLSASPLTPRPHSGGTLIERETLRAEPLREPTAGGSGSQGYGTARRGLRWGGAVAIVVLLLGGWGLVRWRGPSSFEAVQRTAAAPSPRKPILVAVLKPVVKAVASEEAQVLASGLRIALIRGLLALDGVQPIPAEQVDEIPGSPAQVVRALAADELVTSRLECRRELCQMALDRIDGKGKGLLWSSQPFTASAERPYLLEEAVQGYLDQGYAGHRMRPEIARLAVRPEDYGEYLLLRRAFEDKREGKRVDPETLFARLAAIRKTSPRFLDAYVFESEVRQQRYKASRDPRDLERAGELLKQARALAPLDPRPPTGEFGLAMIRGDLEGAEAALRTLEQLQPGDPAVLINRGRLLEKQGRIEEALSLLRKGVRELPSWRNLFRAAEIEDRQGRYAAARQDLGELLARYPENYQGLAKLGEVELAHGSTPRAVEIYTALVKRYPGPPEINNLGVSQMYLGNYEEAEKSFRRFAGLEPRSPVNLLNLADALHLQGRLAEAKEAYRRVVATAGTEPRSADEQVLSARAQALAHLGDGPGAIEAIQTLLRVAPEDPQTSYSASLVYTLLGDRNAAGFNALKALRQGFAPKLFALPWFDPLRSDPAFNAEVARRAGPRPS